MGFMSLFRSQVPNIIDRLKELREELECAQKDIERLDNLERRLEAQKDSKFHYEEILKSALDTFGVALWVKDINSHFLFVNQVCCETILRCTIDEALLKTDSDFENDALAKICHISDKRVMESQKTRRFIEHAVYADGEDVYIDTIKSPIFNKDVLVGTAGSGVNITGCVPEEIRMQNRPSNSIELPVDTLLGPVKLIEILERRIKTRSADDSSEIYLKQRKENL